MDIDLDPLNTERPAPPTVAPTRRRHRQRSASPTTRKTKAMRLSDRALIAFCLVQEARQIYPAEDDCPIGAATCGKRS